MGAARERMPDTYVAERWHLSVTCLIAHIGKPLTDVLGHPQLSAKGTLPARKMKCVSGRTNVAVAMDTLELAVTLVRAFCLFAFFQLFHFSLAVLSTFTFEARFRSLTKKIWSSKRKIQGDHFTNRFIPTVLPVFARIFFLPFQATSFFIFVVLTFDLAHKPEHFH